MNLCGFFLKDIFVKDHDPPNDRPYLKAVSLDLRVRSEKTREQNLAILVQS